jgi:integrase
MRGSVNKRGKSWQVRVDLGPDPVTGKRRQGSKTFRTRKEAEIELARWLREIDTGTALDPSRMTFGEFLDHWLEEHLRHRLRPSTFNSYRAQVRLHIRPVLGGTPMQKLQPMQIQALYAAKLTGERADGRESGLSPKSVRYLHGIIHQALDQALQWQMVTRNIADSVTPPRTRQPRIQTWDADEVRRFLEAAEGDTYGPLWILALGTGMRRGELLGLRWQDLDLAGARLHVRQCLVEIGGVPTLQEPKTASGRRVVALPPSVTDTLRAHRTSQLEQRLAIGSAWQDHDLVIAKDDGSPVTPGNVNRHLNRIARKAGVPRIRFHDLRHTHATLLLRQRVHPKIVSERLGHATIAMTLDTYSHVLPDMQEQAATEFEGLLFRT